MVRSRGERVDLRIDLGVPSIMPLMTPPPLERRPIISPEAWFAERRKRNVDRVGDMYGCFGVSLRVG